MKKKTKKILLATYPIVIISDQNIIIIHLYVFCFSAGETEHGRQRIGFYVAHKRVHAIGGGNSSIRVCGIDTDHNMVESYVERLLQVKGS